MFLVVMTQLVFDLDEFFHDRISIVFADAFEKQVHIIFQKSYRTVFRRASDPSFLMFAGVQEILLRCSGNGFRPVNAASIGCQQCLIACFFYLIELIFGVISVARLNRGTGALSMGTAYSNGAGIWI